LATVFCEHVIQHYQTHTQLTHTVFNGCFPHEPGLASWPSLLFNLFLDHAFDRDRPRLFIFPQNSATKSSPDDLHVLFCHCPLWYSQRLTQSHLASSLHSIYPNHL